MCYDVRSALIVFDDVLWYRMDPDPADIEKLWNRLEAERSYTCASKHALILQFSKMSLRVGTLWEI